MRQSCWGSLFALSDIGSRNTVSINLKPEFISIFLFQRCRWCLLALAFSYWLIDVKKIRGWILFFNVVGLNSLFIYMVTNTGGNRWFHRIAAPFVQGAFGWAGDLPAKIATSLVVYAMLWYLCYWLYKKRIFIKM